MRGVRPRLLGILGAARCLGLEGLLLVLLGPDPELVGPGLRLRIRPAARRRLANPLLHDAQSSLEFGAAIGAWLFLMNKAGN